MHTEFIEALERGTWDEGMIEEYLLRHVYTREQKKFLHDNDLTTIMIINGRSPGELREDVYDWMRSVNTTLGYKIFITV